jgi:hypothetical protein
MEIVRDFCRVSGILLETSVSSTNTSDDHDKDEMLLKKNQTNILVYIYCHNKYILICLFVFF